MTLKFCTFLKFEGEQIFIPESQDSEASFLKSIICVSRDVTRNAIYWELCNPQ